MFSNLVKIAVRNLLKYKTFSFINLFGLTIGAACCLYILLYVQEQQSYDKHHHDNGSLFRVTSDLYLPDDQEPKRMATCSPPIAPAIKAEFPEVEEATRVCSPPGVERNLFRLGDKVFYEKKGLYADSTFLRVFDYRFLAGDPRHALDEPNSVVISENLALRLFNTNEVLNQQVSIGGQQGEQKFKVTGVFNGALGRSHIMPEFIMTMNSGGIGEYVRIDDSWAGNNFIYGYLRLRADADAEALEAKLPAFLQRHGATQLAQLNMKKTLQLQPVADIRTDPQRDAELSPGVSSRFLNILLMIAGFIMLVACINFMNLTTARSTRRAQEVGVRKAIGAPKGALIGQFLGESMLLALLAVLLAIPAVYAALPYLNFISGAEVSLDFGKNRMVWSMVGLLVLLTGLVAGSYPAFYLSSFKPVTVLRGISSVKSGSSVIWLRKGLVVSQFVIASALIIGAIVIRHQLNYMLTKDLGFEKSQKVVFQFRTAEGQRMVESFRNEIRQLPEVVSASAMAVCPGQQVYNDIPMYKPGQDMNTATDIRFTFTDEHYLDALKIKLLAGRFFTPGDTSTQQGVGKVVINETALKRLNIPLEQAPGTVLRSEFRDRRFEMTVIGVMQDFFYETLNNEIDPFMVVAAPPGELTQVVADVRTNDYPAFFTQAGNTWKKVIPGLPFEYTFLDSDFEKLYKTEQTLSRIIGAFTLVAILISCLGLFGLSAFTAEQRTKEIGIRKVLGASAWGITGLLTRDFLKLVLIALLLAAPVAWWAMNQWLEDFAYRVQLGWWIFALAGVIAIVVTFLTVCTQSVKAALANPVRSLRSE